MESNILSNKLPITLGTDPKSNESVHIDLAQCGNLLIGGATKQGKSHCVHNLISQLNTLPEPPKMILFDPKRCEFGRYKDRFRVIEDLDEAKHVLFEELFENEIIRKRYLSTCKDRSPLIIIIDELLDLIFMHKSQSLKYNSGRNRYQEQKTFSAESKQYSTKKVSVEDTMSLNITIQEPVEHL